MEAVKRELLGQYALTQEIKDIQATQEECEAYYNEHKAMFVKEAKATAKHILTETEEESKKVLEEIESGAKTFEDAAKEYSKCPSKSTGWKSWNIWTRTDGKKSLMKRYLLQKLVRLSDQ